MERRIASTAYRLVGAVTITMVTALPVWAGRVDAAAQEGTWVGRVEKHGRHYDYFGRSCPIETEDPCPDYTVKYQIVPTSAQAARALPKVAGHRARLIGHKELVREPGHGATLMVSEVQSKRAPDDPIGEP
jgi:hypothetical protein